MNVTTLAKRFLRNRLAEGGTSRSRFYAKHLRRFLTDYGGWPLQDIRGHVLNEVKENMLRDGFAAKTINHDLTAIVTMFRWAEEIEIIPHCSLRVRKCPLPLITSRAWTVDEVRRYVFSPLTGRYRAGTTAEWDLTLLLGLEYITVVRPSELVRIAGGLGEWVEPGVLVLPSKMDYKCRTQRHIVFNEEALCYYEDLKNPSRWTWHTYSRAAKATRGKPPHQLRHSGACHLHKIHHIPRDTVDLILGHYPSTVSRTYIDLDWQSLRSQSRLTLC